MENREENPKMTFGDYYRSLNKERRSELKNSIIANFGVAYPTFYAKLSRGNFSPLEKKELERLCQTSFSWD